MNKQMKCREIVEFRNEVYLFSFTEDKNRVLLDTGRPDEKLYLEMEIYDALKKQGKIKTLHSKLD